MTDLTIFRQYEPDECGTDGYPFAWHDLTPQGGPPVEVAGTALAPGVGIKHLVRREARNRCIRCGHPFVVGQSSVYDEGDDLHAARTERDTGQPIEVVNLAFEQLIADGSVTIDPKGARKTNWSPCDDSCEHGGPVRVRRWATSEWERLERVHGDKPFGEAMPLPSPRAMISASRGTDMEGEVQAAWRILTVHHLDEVKANCRWWNLVALCQRCHLEIQGKVQMERIYPFEHSDWFKPYVAGYYAHTYLGEYLTREQAELRMDDLLALERMV